MKALIERLRESMRASDLTNEAADALEALSVELDKAKQERDHFESVHEKAVRRHVNAERELAALKAQSEPMVPLRMEWEPGYPEDVAFGSQRQMDRLKKWLDKYFAMIIAAKAQSEPVGVATDGRFNHAQIALLNKKLPIGTPLFTHAQPADRDAEWRYDPEITDIDAAIRKGE